MGGFFPAFPFIPRSIPAMATDTENAAVATAPPHSDHAAQLGEHDHDHGGHHDHDHPPFLAHHFDTPQQQFDSGKLGMWLFLVTEVLFFSGMFCAYAIYRSLRPDVFEGNSQFLNTQLGAINTGVLLFSSLTAAWAVRCSQTGEQKKLVAMLAATISCAMIFLGVKTIEYSHKWDMGLKPAGLFHYNPDRPHGEGGLGFPVPFSDMVIPYLTGLCLPFGILAVGCLVWLVISAATGRKFQFECAKPLTVAAFCFFAGVLLGRFLEPGAEGHESHDGEHHAEAGDHHDAGSHAVAMTDGHDDHDHDSGDASELAADPNDAVYSRLAQDNTNSGIMSELEARQQQRALARGTLVDDPDAVISGIDNVDDPVFTRKTAGVFFSIYYCMTGVHAIHILAGIGVLVWLLIRSVRGDFNAQYFGPVDYVGLYWHLVDLIWIYLFPLLYLIR